MHRQQHKPHVRATRTYLNETLYQRLMTLAENQKRSVPAQLEWIIEQYLATEDAAHVSEQQTGKVA